MIGLRANIMRESAPFELGDIISIKSAPIRQCFMFISMILWKLRPLVPGAMPYCIHAAEPYTSITRHGEANAKMGLVRVIA